MGGFLKSLALWFVVLLAGKQLTAQPESKVIFTDRNYKQIPKEKDAAYEIKMWEINDTIYFETFSKNPKGKIESGKYPQNQGFDLRNCQLIRYWPNGKIRAYGTLKQSWSEGLWVFSDEGGDLYSKVEFKDGLMQGTARRFYPTGLIRSFTYDRNIKSGESILYDTAGNIYTIENYFNDSLHGLVQEFYSPGVRKRKALYSHGVIQKDTMYYEAGGLFNCENYDTLGNLNGRNFIYTPSGKIARFDEYSHGIVIQSNCIHPLAGADYEGDDCPPRLKSEAYPGGIEKFNEYARLNQDYPEDAIKWKQQGVIVYEVLINNYGFVDGISEENIVPLGFGLEKESMRLLTKMKKFEPRSLNGKTMPSKMRIPFVFILQE